MLVCFAFKSNSCVLMYVTSKQIELGRRKDSFPYSDCPFGQGQGEGSKSTIPSCKLRMSV